MFVTPSVVSVLVPMTVAAVVMFVTPVTMVVLPAMLRSTKRVPLCIESVRMQKVLEAHCFRF